MYYGDGGGGGDDDDELMQYFHEGKQKMAKQNQNKTISSRL